MIASLPFPFLLSHFKNEGVTLGNICHSWMRSHHKYLALYLTMFQICSCSQAPACAFLEAGPCYFKSSRNTYSVTVPAELLTAQQGCFWIIKSIRLLLLTSYITSSGQKPSESISASYAFFFHLSFKHPIPHCLF